MRSCVNNLESAPADPPTLLRHGKTTRCVIQREYDVLLYRDLRHHTLADFNEICTETEQTIGAAHTYDPLRSSACGYPTRVVRFGARPRSHLPNERQTGESSRSCSLADKHVRALLQSHVWACLPTRNSHQVTYILRHKPHNAEHQDPYDIEKMPVLSAVLHTAKAE